MVGKKKPTKRNIEIRKLYSKGMSTMDIKEKFNISRDLVYQIIRGYATRYCRYCDTRIKEQDIFTTKCLKCANEIKEKRDKSNNERIQRIIESRLLREKLSKENSIKKAEKIIQRKLTREENRRSEAEIKKIEKDYRNKSTIVNCVICSSTFHVEAWRTRKRGNPSMYCDVCSKYINSFGGRDRTRELVRIRDKYTCQDCGKIWVKGKRRFDIHHFNECGKKSMSYDSKHDLSGMITLCHKCHFNRPEHTTRKKSLSLTN